MSELSKKEKFKAYVTAKGLNVRTWAGAEYNICSFSPLSRGDIVSVCDTILSKDKKKWYYIKYKDKYGFINASYVQKVPDIALRFIGFLKTYNVYIKNNGSKFYYHFDPNLTTFQKAKNLIAEGKKVGITCVVPCRWGLKALGISPNEFWGKDGTFKHCYKGEIKEHLNRITSGDAIGLTVKQAVNKGLLMSGDICTFKDTTHTFVYSGDKYYAYDGGHAAIKNDKYIGIKIDYSKSYKNRKISEILRWK